MRLLSTRTPHALLAILATLLVAAPAVMAADPVGTKPGDYVAMNASGALVVKGPALLVSTARCVEPSCSSTQANILPGFYAEGEWTVLATVTSEADVNFSWSIAGWSGSTGDLSCPTPGEIVLKLNRTTQTWTAACPV